MPVTFKELAYLEQKWNIQVDRPIAEMRFYQRAHVFAELAFGCYWAEKYMRELCEHFGIADLSYFNFEGAQAYILWGEHDTIVACRGTEATDWNDIRADLKVWKVVAETVGKVHGGFKDEVDHLWPDLEEALESNKKPLYFTGHSLGGAMAQICAARCKLSGIGSEPLEIQTFGSPRVGDKRYITHCKIKKIRWVNNNDFVPRFPPAIFGYRHTGLEMYIDYEGNISGKSGLSRIVDGLSGFAKSITKAQFDHFSDHLMPGYIAPLMAAAKDE
ncbi:MAG: triacylglycerol lipase [Verrucomicrobiales bacterium]|jgi:triacylglycerol lipase